MEDSHLSDEYLRENFMVWIANKDFIEVYVK